MGRHRRSSDDEPSDDDYGPRSASELLRAAGYDLPESRRRRGRRDLGDGETPPPPPQAAPAPAGPRHAEPQAYRPGTPGPFDGPPAGMPAEPYAERPPARRPERFAPGRPDAGGQSHPGFRTDPRLGQVGRGAPHLGDPPPRVWEPDPAPRRDRPRDPSYDRLPAPLMEPPHGPAGRPPGARIPQPSTRPSRPLPAGPPGALEPARGEPPRRNLERGDDQRGRDVPPDHGEPRRHDMPPRRDAPPGREVVLSGERRLMPLRRDRAGEPDDVPSERRSAARGEREVVVGPAAEPHPRRRRRESAEPDRPEDLDEEYLDVDDDADEEEDAEPSLRQAWTSYIGQILVAAAGGLGIWLGFQALWRRWPWGAAPAAGLVLVGMLLAGHHLHRRRHPDEPLDLVTVGVLLIVGLVLTVSPAAFVLRPL